MEQGRIMNRIPDSAFQKPLNFVAFGFGSGVAPVAPGTFGTLLAIPFFLLFAHLSLALYLLMLLVFSVFSTWLLTRVSVEIGEHDHTGMNLDEFVGYFFTMIAVPPTALNILIGFVLFRLFDIWKPYPISWVDKNVHGGFGMIFDDILAGLVSCIILQVLLHFFHMS
jgi:phosphatidylglycerophosphatase A